MNVNVRTDMLRQGTQQQTMLMNSPAFMQNAPQSGQQLGPGHLNMPPNTNPNSGLVLVNTPNAMNPSQQQRYNVPMHQQPGSRQQRPMEIRQGQGGGQPMMNPGGGPLLGGGAPHMGGLPHNQAMSFNAGVMQHPQGAVRRVSSQPQLNPSSGPLVGMPPGVTNSLSMGMNSQGNLGNNHQMTQQMRQHIAMGQQMQAQPSPDMPLGINRQPGNPGIPPGRSSSAQLMNSLSQPPSLPHAMGRHQNQFQNPQMPPQHQQPQIPSPRQGSHTPNMAMATPGPSHTPVNRSQMTPDNNSMSFMNFPNQPPFLQQHGNSRMNGQPFSFLPSSTPPIPIADMPQQMPGMSTPNGTPTRQGFPTPAQQYEQMSTGTPPENFSAHFGGMPPPPHAPPPPSHNNHHPPLPQQQPHPPQQPQHHHSPHHSDHMNSHPQRPQSQPQTVVPRPPSSSGQQPHSPRSAHPQLPPGAPPQLGPRMNQPHHTGPQPMQPGTVQHLSIAPRPPAPVMPTSANAPPSQAPSDTPPSGPAAIPRPIPNITLSLGSGQGLIRLLQFSGVLSSDNKAKLQLLWWNELVKEYFTPKAVMKFTLWKDNQRNEAKPFEIGVPILPRFFLVTTQSGVKSMTLTLDGARERMYAHGHSVVECVSAVWTYKYHNGYTVTLRGPLTVHVVITSSSPPGASQAAQTSPQYVLKFEDFQFDANLHDKYIALEAVVGTRVMEQPKTPHVHARNAPNSTPNGVVGQQQQLEEDKKWEEPRVTIERACIPGEPVNAFGIPQATMRCLELAESVGQMADLIAFSTETDLGPLDALNKFASNIREKQNFILPLQHNIINGVGPPINPFTAMHSNANNMASTPAVTLYSSAPPSVTNPSGNPPPSSLGSPKNSPSASNSPQKQHKTIPQQAQASSSSVPAVSPSVSSGATTNTPALSNASLKRKQGSDATSPTTTTPEQPPQKRATRKRGRTTTGGG